MRGWLTVLVLVGSSFADDLDVRVARIRAELASDDPAVRDAAGPELVAVAKKDGARLVQLLEDADPEVRGRAYDVLAWHGILLRDGEAKVLHELLADCAQAERALRRACAEQALRQFGPVAAGCLARELEEGTFEAVAIPTRVAAPGSAQPVELRVVNRGATACWVPADDILALPDIRHFAKKPVRILRCGGCSSHEIFGPDHRTEEQRLLDELEKRRRIAPGEGLVVGKVPVPATCGILHVSSRWQGRTRKVEADLYGRLLRVPAHPEAALPSTDLVLLGERRGEGFLAEVVEDGDGWALSLKARLDRPPAKLDSQWENAWWAAEGDGCEFLGSGALATAQEDRWAWTRREKRVFRMTDEVPAGTRRLWLGFNYDFGDEQYVPAPVELK